MCFVTANVNDFADTDGAEPQLHRDLVSDLRERALSADSVMVMQGIDELLDRFIVPSLQNEEEIATALMAGTLEDLKLVPEFESEIEGFIHVHRELLSRGRWDLKMQSGIYGATHS